MLILADISKGFTHARGLFEESCHPQCHEPSETLFSLESPRHQSFSVAHLPLSVQMLNDYK